MENKYDLGKLIKEAMDRKFSFLTLKVDEDYSSPFELKKYRTNEAYWELQKECAAIIGGAEFLMVDDSCPEEYVMLFENNNMNRDVNMMNFIAPTPRTFKQEVGLVCSMIYNGTEMALVIVRGTDGSFKEYKKADYDNYKKMTMAIVEDFVGYEYKTSKIVNFEGVIVLEKSNIEESKGVVDMKFGRALKEIGKYNVVGLEAIEMLEDENTYIQGMLCNNYEDVTGEAYETITNNCRAIDNIRASLKSESNNMSGVVNMSKMTKAELREELAKRGVEFSNNEFKATKHQELVDRLELEFDLEKMPVPENTPLADFNDEESQNSNSLMVERIVLPEEEQLMIEESEEEVVPQFTAAALGSLMASAVTNGIRTAVQETVIPAVKNVVEDANAKVLAELKAQLDTMNATIAGLVNRAPVSNVQAPREVLGHCEDCGAGITNANVIKNSKANCGGHVYCYTHQQSHKVARTNPVGSFGQPQPQQQATVIYKNCMCCGTKTKYDNVTVLNNSIAKAQALNLKPIICSKCANKILAERKAQQATTQPVPPVNPQMPVGRFTAPANPNKKGF